ncbi:NAD-dependent succinate-semialdehyde dehydrogenase [Phreatobacter aquaticus]|uniref:NAD-dependent succinate-semialdehyde dehydrogenase n=1 Tax=Phreatobacter aquaticus TaxID=2570229 RepID=A0A4D7QNC7_9HYPH|nr:NAD-dependent succinate-semialdehyde dehydrogenase [Phreatobacter aquaticus]QCK86784.1 NAD-dependent succinate-semialdehyde dehydrogenase [Phreatobacter aquaticus]
MNAPLTSAPLALKDPSLLKSQCYVNGEWIGKGVDPIINPATGQTIALVPRFGAKEAAEAVEHADRAFKLWSKKTAKERSNILRKWFDLMIANTDDLATIMTAEQGKPLAEAKGEIAYAASFVEFFSEEARRVNGEVIPTHRPDHRIIVQKQPIGVCAAITPWNFPAAMITRKCSPAIAVGCTTVVKPAPETPLTALALAELAHRAGLPAGVLNIITGDAAPIGKTWCEHPTVRFIGFTGSTPVGKLLMAQAASTVKRVGLELGGNAPFIVFDDADIDAAVEGAMASKYRNMGQTCVCANRLYVHETVHDEFVAKFTAKVRELKVGNGFDVGVTQGPLIKAAAVDKVVRHVEDALAKGAKVETGGKRSALGQTFYEPTVLSGVTKDMIVTQEETFGPVAPVYKFKTEDEVIHLANDQPFGLASYFYGRDIGRIFRVAEALEFGMVGINTGMVGVDVAPFGGVKESGLGREGSHHGVEEFLELKLMMLGGIDK